MGAARVQNILPEEISRLDSDLSGGWVPEFSTSTRKRKGQISDLVLWLARHHDSTLNRQERPQEYVCPLQSLHSEFEGEIENGAPLSGGSHWYRSKT